MRNASLQRKTTETDISLSLSLDGQGNAQIQTGCGFFDHMLTLLARHAEIDLSICCKGDTFVDYHHSVEDVGIVLGNALKEALGDKRGIGRYGSIILPMDEALILASVDVSGRGLFVTDLSLPAKKVGDFDTELVKEFFIALAHCANITLHIKQLSGENTHHIIEGAFKAFARARKEAVRCNGSDQIPSTKGVL